MAGAPVACGVRRRPIYTGPVSPARQFLLYSLLRVGLFAATFAALLVMQVNPFLAAALAAVIGLCITYIFFRRQRDELTRAVEQWRTSGRADQDGDGDAEDDLIGGTAASAPRLAVGPESGDPESGRSESGRSDSIGAGSDRPDSEREGDAQADAVDQGGEARQLEREHELRSGATGERDDHGREGRQ